MLLVTAALIERDGKYLVTQRPAGTWMEYHWEFPGGKVEQDEDPRAAVVREIREELGLQTEPGEVEEVLYHQYPDRTVLLLFFHTVLVEGEPAGLEGQLFAWVTPEEMSAMSFLPADEPILKRLMRTLG
jgi:8-oxo-dGTP diphosphatase